MPGLSNWMYGKAIAWFDKSGDGLVDHYVVYNGNGLYYANEHNTFPIAHSGNFANMNAEQLKGHAETVAKRYAATPNSWSFSTEAGGSGTGYGQPIEEGVEGTGDYEGQIISEGESWAGATTGITEFQDTSISSDDFINDDGSQMTPEEAFDELVDKGVLPEDAKWEEYYDEIITMPQFQGADPEAEAERVAGITEDVYGFETDIARAKEDIGTAAEGARSDIYGLQTQAAQQKRAGMFGKGLGGGMRQLAQQDTSRTMRASGQGIMSGLASEVQGQRRVIEDATTGLYGVGGTGADDLGIGGIYGTGGTEETGKYNLAQQSESEWESDMEGFLAGLVD